MYSIFFDVIKKILYSSTCTSNHYGIEYYSSPSMICEVGAIRLMIGNILFEKVRFTSWLVGFWNWSLTVVDGCSNEKLFLYKCVGSVREYRNFLLTRKLLLNAITLLLGIICPQTVRRIFKELDIFYQSAYNPASGPWESTKENHSHL